MQILKFLDLFFGAFINFVLCVYIIKKVFDLKFSVLIKKRMIYIFIVSLTICIINIINKYTFKMLFTLPITIYGIKKIYNLNYKDSILFTLSSVIYMIFGELLFGIILIIFPYDYNNTLYKLLGTTCGSIIVLLFTMPLIYIKKFKNLLNNLTIFLMKKQYYVFLFIVILFFCSISYKNVFNVKNILDSISNFLVFISFIFLFYMFISEILKFDNLSKQYNEMFKYLEKYEKELIEKRKIIHDYNNQLIIINGYINNPLKLKEYISEIINEQKELKNNKLIKNIDKLPTGIKGLIYFKISQLNENIIINLSVKNSLKKFEKLPAKINKDILKIIGILLDNALEAVEKENEKIIKICLSCKKNVFEFKITNSFTKKINANEIMNSGYSTKGKNRGYGLALVNEIVKKNGKIKYNYFIANQKFISELVVEFF